MSQICIPSTKQTNIVQDDIKQTNSRKKKSFKKEDSEDKGEHAPFFIQLYFKSK